MKPNFFNFIKAGISTFILAGICLSAHAQKANNVQEESVWASSVKIDGKLSDWGNTFKATNKDTHLSYTMANDDKNLYLVIQSSEAANNSKIMLGGISLTLNADDKKKIGKEAFTVTFPVVARGAGRGGAAGGGRGQGGAQGGFGGAGGRGLGATATQLTQKQRDSMQTAQARTQLAAAKEIKVHGFKSITDSIISIYNEYNLQATANIDEKGVFIYELAIPLEALEMSADKPKEFSYNIKINGLQFGGGGQGGFGGGAAGGGQRGGGGGGGQRGGGAAGGFGGAQGGRGGNAAGGEDRLALMSPTDFWGKYTLTKK